MKNRMNFCQWRASAFKRRTLLLCSGALLAAAASQPSLAVGIRAHIPGGSSAAANTASAANTQTGTDATSNTAQAQSTAASSAAAQATLTKATLALQARQARSAQRAAAILGRINQNQAAGQAAAQAAGNPSSVLDGLQGTGQAGQPNGLVPTGGVTASTPVTVQSGAAGAASVTLPAGTGLTLPPTTGGNSEITVSGSGTVGTITVGGTITNITGGVPISAPPGATISLPQGGSIAFSAAGAIPTQLATYALPSSWNGISGVTQSIYGAQGQSQTTVTLTQSQQQAVLNWQTFNVGANTTLDFDQSAGGANVDNWIAFNTVAANIAPSQILGRIQGPGQVYVINQNGVIFGGASQINLHNLTVSTLPINPNLAPVNPNVTASGLLDNPDDQFLFSQLNIAQGASGTPAFTPDTSTSNEYAPAPTHGTVASASTAGGIANAGGQDGDIIVEPGAQLNSPSTPESVGGRIALVAPNVVNNGVIATPDGQTILAAGLQVGFQAHASSDPSLRGLDTYVGPVSDPTYDGGAAVAGTVTNNGQIESDEGDISLNGATVNQMGVLGSATSVSLNGRIDLNASYDTQVPEFTANNSVFVSFDPTLTGDVTFGPESITTILPELSNTDTVPGTSGTGGVLQLALPSQVNVTGANINLQADATGGALVYAPSANVTMNAGTYLFSSGSGGTDVFQNNTGEIYLAGGVGTAPGATIDVSGSTDVSASVAEDVIAVQLRSSQLENSPVQQGGALDGDTVYVDILNTGTYNGQPWVGTPLGDTSGYVGLIPHTVGELTVNGGTVTLTAGGAVVLGTGSEINVSGGYINYQGATVNDTQVLLDGTPIDISQANPNQVYEGLADGFAVSSNKWSITQTFTSSFVNGTTYLPGFVQGGNGGTVKISSPNQAIDGQLYGNTVAGPNQRTTASQITSTFSSVPGFLSAELAALATPNASSLNISFNPMGTGNVSPDVFFETAADQSTYVAQNPVSAFGSSTLRQNGSSDVVLSQDIVNANGFGNVSIDTSLGGATTSFTAGTVSIPTGSSIQFASSGSLTLPPGVSDDRISVSGANGTVVGTVISPNGTSTPLLANTLTSLSAGSTIVLNNPNETVTFLNDQPGSQAVSVTSGGSYTHGGTLIVPSSVSLTAFSAASATATGFNPGGLMSFNAANIDVEGSIDVAGGNLDLTAADINVQNFTSDNQNSILPANDLTRGNLFLGGGASLSVTGLLIDDISGSPSAGTLPFLTGGGSISAQGYFADLAPGSVLDASGGVQVGSSGKISYGNGGSISITGGQDAVDSHLITGYLELGSSLSAYSGATGGTLNIVAPLIQIGGDPNALLNGDTTNRTLWLDPSFFDQGGFSAFSLTAFGSVNGGTTASPTYATAFLVAPGASIVPIAESLTASADNGSVTLTPLSEAQEGTLLPSQRSAISLTFDASGVLGYNDGTNETLGSLVLGANSVIGSSSAPLVNSITLEGETVAVEGQVYASAGGSGGSITVKAAGSYPFVPGENLLEPQVTLDLGPDSVLSTAGVVELTGNAYGYTTGNVLPGGTITLDGNILVEGGASLNVSGASGVLDVEPGASGDENDVGSLSSPTMVPTRIDSNGGSISITGEQELFLSSTAQLLGAAGAPTPGASSSADGGTLSITSAGDLIFPNNYTGNENITPLVTTLVITQSEPNFQFSPSSLSSDPSIQTALGSTVQANLVDGYDNGPDGLPLYTYFAADSFADRSVNGILVNGGFDTLNLGSQKTGAVQFSGSVSISARSEITIGASGTIFGDAAGDPIVLSAPYVVLGTSGLNSQDPTSPGQPQGSALNLITSDSSVFTYAPSTPGLASLTVNAGTLLSVGNLSLQNFDQVNFNTTLANTPTGTVAAGAPIVVTANGSVEATQAGSITESDGTVVAFAANSEVAVTAGSIITLSKAGSLTPNANGVLPAATAGDVEGDGSLAVSGNMAIVAGQIYPPTETTFTLDASGNGQIVIAAALNGGTPAFPYSAGGTLDVYASSIIQDGVLRAPDGVINLGAAASVSINPLTGVAPDATTILILGSSGQTSVSMDGMTIPYGIINSTGDWIDPSGTDITTSGPQAKMINLQAANVTVSNGATVDVSGGGDLFAYDWVSGTGGTYDILNSTFSVSNYSYSSNNSTSFAVLPGYAAAYAPSSPYSTTGTTSGTSGPAVSSFTYENPVTGGTFLDSGYVSNGLQVGEKVYLGAGSGLPAGYYVLLPARYALLPGAYLITPQTTGAAGSTATQADGSTFVSGYKINGLNAARTGQPLQTEFEVQSQSVVNSYADYELSDANAYFTTSAAANNEAVPRLPQDAGQILLEASTSMTLPSQAGAILAAPGTDGLGGEIEIASPNDINIYDPLSSDMTAATPVSNDLNLIASTLSNLGVGDNLIIGGYVTQTAAGLQLSVTSNDVTVNQDAVLSGADVTLVANQQLRVYPNAQVIALSGQAPSAPTYLIGGGNLANNPFPVSSTNRTTVLAAGSVTASVGGTITSSTGTKTVLQAGVATTVAAGSTITLSGNGTLTSATSGIFAVNGDGALLRVSNDSSAAIVRSSVDAQAVQAAFATMAQPTITIGNGATLRGNGLILDSTYATSLSSQAVLGGSNSTVSLDSGNISLVLDSGSVQPSAGGTSLVLSGEALSSLLTSTQALSLLSYGSIDIYANAAITNAAGPDTIGGAPAAGVYPIKSLGLYANEIQNLGGGDVTISAQDVTLGNNTGGTPPVLSTTGLSGTLAIDASTINLGGGSGNNALTVAGFQNVNFNAAGGVLLNATTSTGLDTNGNPVQGTSTFTTAGDLTITTPLVTGATGADVSLESEGALAVNGSSASPTVTSGLGATLLLQGTTVTDAGTIRLASGNLTLQATAGDVNVAQGGMLNVSGQITPVGAQTEYTPGGTVTLDSATGDVNLASGSTVNVSAPAGAGNAGTVNISAVNGTLLHNGTLLGNAGAGGTGGTFTADLETIDVSSSLGGNDLTPLETLLDTGGFSSSQTIRIRGGGVAGVNNDVYLDGSTVSNDVHAGSYNLSVDQGWIIVSGLIDSHNVAATDSNGNPIEVGGSINLTAGQNIVLTPTAVLNASGQNFNNAGQGGSVSLTSGAYRVVNGVDVTDYSGYVDIQGNASSKAQINLSVAANTSASAATGDFTGTLQIEAPRIGETGIEVKAIDGEIMDASSIAVVGNQVYTTAANGLINGNGTDTTTVVNTLIGPTGEIMTDGNNFLRVAGQAAGPGSNYATMFSSIFGQLNTSNPSLASIENIEAGVEIVNPNGNLVLGPDDLSNPILQPTATLPNETAFDWDLSGFRFGPNGAAGVLTMRAAGSVIFNSSLSDGFVEPTGSPNGPKGSAYNALVMADNSLLPENNQSWSYNITAGADLGAADVNTVKAGSSGNVELGRNDPSPISSSGVAGANGGVAAVLFPSATATAKGHDYYQVIRTGTGSIDISSAGSVQLLNQFATIYTAGVQAPALSSSIFNVPDEILPTSLGGVQYPAQYTMAGGNVTLNAVTDISHLTQNSSGQLIPDSELELPENWLFRRGYVVETGADPGEFGTVTYPTIQIPAHNSEIASTSWWVDFSNFFEGVGALGGGNVTLNAGGNVNNVDALAPTNARVPFTTASGDLLAADQTPVELGGGNVTVNAGNDINAGVYYVERGQGTLDAGYQIVTNATRSISLPAVVSAAAASASTPSETWLPTTLFLGDGSFTVTANGSLDLGPVANPFLLPSGTSNTYYDQTYFSTYGLKDAVNVSSLAGNVTLAESALSQGTDLPLLESWITYVDYLPSFPPNSTASFYEPWLQIDVNDNISAFTGVSALMPPTLNVAAPSGDINLQGSITLSPSATGNLELVADGSVNGLQPNGTAGKTTEWGYSTINVSDANPSAIPGVLSPFAYATFSAEPKFNLNNSNFLTLSIIDQLFAETGSTQNISLQAQQDLHGTIEVNGVAEPLHYGDPNPVVIDAGTGDISGLTLYSPKVSDIVAGQDITDVGLYLQNANDNADAISIVEAGRDIVLYDPTSPLRNEAQTVGNELDIVGDTAVPSQSGDIQIGGPGTLEVLAGRNLTLGSGPETVIDGEASTSVGITSIGGSSNPALENQTGADIVAAASLGSGTGGAGLNFSQLDFGNVTFSTATGSVVALDPNQYGQSFIAQFLDPNSAESSRYLPDLAALMNLPSSASAQQIWTAFSHQTTQQQDTLALNVFYAVLRDAGRDHNDPTSPNSGSYTEGFAAISALFPGGASWSNSGDITLTGREIKTTNGGDISLLAPGGSVTVDTNQLISLVTNPAADQGIVTTDGGNINVFTKDNVSIGSSRIFTLSGGNLIVWSSYGNIAAGISSKTVQAAPPTRVLINPQSGNVETDLAGLATGGGIGILASRVGAPPSDVDLIAPNGVVDAGDAGIRASGNLNIAAVQVLNASNISVGGKSSGLPTVSVPNVSVAVAAGNTTGAMADEAQQVAQNQHTGNAELTVYPSLINVEVLGYGGGDGDDDDDSSDDDSRKKKQH